MITVPCYSLKLFSDYAKNALRFGFHQTHACADFEMAFLCIQKCLELKFDVAHADKECKCTCFHNRDKAKYKEIPNDINKGRLTAPTTAMPAWVLPLLPSTEFQESENSEDEDEKGKNDTSVVLDIDYKNVNSTVNSNTVAVIGNSTTLDNQTTSIDTNATDINVNHTDSSNVTSGN